MNLPETLIDIRSDKRKATLSFEEADARHQIAKILRAAHRKDRAANRYARRTLSKP